MLGNRSLSFGDLLRMQPPKSPWHSSQQLFCFYALYQLKVMLSAPSLDETSILVIVIPHAKPAPSPSRDRDDLVCVSPCDFCTFGLRADSQAVSNDGVLGSRWAMAGRLTFLDGCSQKIGSASERERVCQHL